MKKRAFATLAVFSILSIGLSSEALALRMSDLAKLVGYTIVYSGYVTGYANEDGSSRRDGDFEGCDYGRKIFVDDRYAFTCASYSYSYAYHPKVVVLSNGSSVKLIINDVIYDVR